MKTLCLISGGIDSPVAAHLLMAKEVEMDFVYFDNYPFSCKKGLEKAKALVRALARLHKRKLTLFIVPNGKNHEAFLKKGDRRHLCVLCRRMMFRIAELLAVREKAKYLVTGENLAQVASQTIPNLIVTSQATRMEILRPVLANDKNETIAIAEKIGTYELSIQPSSCCTHLPKNPTTRAHLKEILQQEQSMPIQELAAASLLKAEVMHFQ